MLVMGEEFLNGINLIVPFDLNIKQGKYFCQVL